jgi:hypothetical protein
MSSDRYVFAALKPLEEFVRDPALTVACVLLIVVSVAWVVFSRLIYGNLRRAARNALRAQGVETEPVPEKTEADKPSSQEVWHYTDTQRR